MNLILLSGGMDSALCLHKYGAKLAIGFHYGQRHKIELRYAKALAEKKKVEYRIETLPYMPLIDAVVFAGRNAVFLSHAVAIAQREGLDSIIIGCNFSDAQRFPDCRPEFIKNMNNAFKEAYGVSVHAPLLTTTKKQIVQEVKELGLDTWTCYNPVNEQPCGECYACKSLRS